ncbi:MAG: TonB-dependent receptor [Pseudomonadales bacterium]|nr:TonB-dependent receptor [Pseudomonadales bacterium]MCP5172014.1 TonB-dependent receptor [Pseudomonadales bacterium]
MSFLRKVIAVLCFVSVAHGQGVNGSGVEEVLVSALRIPIDQQVFTGSHSSLNSEEIALLGATHIQEALARIPGVNLHHNSGQEYLPAIRSPVLTGAGACGSFLMAEEGIPLRPAGFCNVNELFESHSDVADRIDVIRGPSEVLYGSNALHGVVNVITPEPGSFANSASVEMSSEDYYRTQLQAGNEQWAVFFTGIEDQGFRDDYSVDQQKLTLKYQGRTDEYRITAGMTVINLNQETAGYITGANSYRDKSVTESNPNPEAYRDAQAVRLWTRIENEDPGNHWVVTPYVRYSDMAFLQHFLPGTPLEENGQHSVGWQSAYFIAAKKSRFVIGFDGEYVDGWLKQSQDQPTGGSAFLQATIPVGDHYDYTVKAVQLAPFIHWNYQLTEDLSLSLSARYEWMQYDYDNRMLDGRTRDDGTPCGFGGCRYSRPADGKDTFNNFSPKLGLNYRISDNQRFFFSLASGFRAPQAVELYRLQRDQQLTDIDSEKLNSIELGYQSDSGRLKYEIVAYAMKKRNLIYRNSDFFTIDSGRSRHLGLELSLAYDFSDQLTVSLAATQARHTYDHHDPDSGIEKGDNIDSAPHHFGNMAVNWTPTDALSFEIEWQHVGSYYTDPENKHRYPGHDLLNLRGQYQLSPNVELSARLINATDRRYADRADYTAFSGERYFPGAPRTAFFAISYQW